MTNEPTSLLDRDLSCCRCGYSLRGLAREGNCPECGQSVWDSLQQFTLAFADPAWLARLRRAGRLVSWVFFAAMPVFPLPLVWVVHLLGVTFKLSFGFIYSGQAVLCGLLLLQSIWFATSPNPGMAARERSLCPRVVARVAVLGVLTWIGIVTAEVIYSGPLSFLYFIQACQIGSPFGVLGAIAVWGIATHYESIAAQAGNEFYAKKAKAYRSGFIITAVGTNTLTLMAVFVHDLFALAAILCAAVQAGFGALVLLFPANLEEVVEVACGEWTPDPKLPATTNLNPQN